MEDHTRLKTAGFKVGFLAGLASAGLSKGDLPGLMEKFAAAYYPQLLKQADLSGIGGLAAGMTSGAANVLAEVVEAGGRLVPEALNAAIYKVPYATAGLAALGGGALALGTAKQEARAQKVHDEELRIKRLIAATEAANAARGIPIPNSMPQVG